MNHLAFIIVVILSTILLLPTQILAGSSYFWAGDQKVSIAIDYSTLVVVFKQDKYHKNVASAYAQVAELSEATISGDQKMVVLVFRGDQIKSKTELLNDLQLEQGDIEWYSFGYIANGVTPLRPTNRIAFKLKTDFTKDALEPFIKGKAVFDHTPFGTPQIKMIRTTDDIISLANQIYESGIVEYCHPDFIANIIHHNDPLYPKQYYLNHIKQIGIGGVIDTDIDAPQAWDITTGSSTIKVAVIDDGVEEHDDLKDGNGVSRIVGGYTPQGGGNGGPSSVHDKHAVPVAGILAASHNNINVRGVAPNIKLLTVNVLTSGTTDQEVADGINWAWRNGADILSNSWGYFCNQSGFTWPAIKNAIDSARIKGRGGKGSVVVFSAGNNQPTDVCGFGPAGYITFPSTVTGVLCVSASNKNGFIASYSSRGSRIDVTALGGEKDIRTLDRMGSNGYNAGNDMEDFEGTSAACPQVAGVAALILSVNPNLTEQQVRNIITSTATDMGAPGRDDLFGWGRVDAAKAVARVFSQINQQYNFIEGTPLINLLNSNVVITFTTRPTPDIAAARYTCDRYVMTIPDNVFVQTPLAWFITSEGFSFANSNNATGWYEKTTTSSSVSLQTVFYYIKKIFDTGQTINKWAPFDPNPVIMRNYGVLGIPAKLFLNSTRGTIYWGQTSTITASTNAPEQNWSYSWTTSTIPQGIEFSSYGNKAYLTNSYFKNGQQKEPIAAVGITCTATNSDGGAIVNSITIGLVSASPGGGGCPFVYTWNGNEFVEDNNILPQSEYVPKEDGFVTDHYQLFTSPALIDDTYRLRVGEFEQEQSLLDNFKLMAVDHEPEVSISVNDNGDISQYAKPAAIASAQLDDGDVYKLVYELDHNYVEAQPDETLQLTFEEQQSGVEKALLISAVLPPGEEKKLIAGKVQQNIEGKMINTHQFRLRRNPSFIWIPVEDGQSKDGNLEIGITWQQKANVDFTELSHKLDLPYTTYVCDLTLAEHSQSGDVTGLLLEDDNDIAVLNPGEYVDLVFNAPPLVEGKKRSLIFVSRGRYERIEEPKESATDGLAIKKNLQTTSSQNIPTKYVLHQNHPNPFNPVTTIRYELPEISNVVLKIYDILGKEVATLVNGVQDAGYKEVVFDASRLTSGVYLYKLQAGSYTNVKKMVLMR